MSQLIDLCGTPIQLDKITDFKLVKREVLFYPSYQETEESTFSRFARFGASPKKKFEFVKMVPYGAILSDKEKPTNNGYEIKSFGEGFALNIFTKAEKLVDNAATLAADLLRIDTSSNKEYRILTHGRRLVTVKLRDIPAKVAFLSGKVSDVYKNDSNYALLGEPIAPTIVTVPTLIVTVNKATHVFFGGGIDIPNAEETYHQLFDAFSQMQANNAIENARMPKAKISINLPKLSMPSIKLQAPIVLKKTDASAIESSDNDQSLTEL